MSNLPEPVRISPLIKLVRYSLLIAGIFYGAAKKKAIQMYEARREPEKQRLRMHREIKLAKEKRAAAERDLAEIIAIFTPKPELQNYDKDTNINIDMMLEDFKVEEVESSDQDEVKVNVQSDFDGTDGEVSILSSLLKRINIKDDMDNVPTPTDIVDGENESVQKYFVNEEMEDTVPYNADSVDLIEENIKDEVQNVQIFVDNDEAENVQTPVANDDRKKVRTYVDIDGFEIEQTYITDDESENIPTYSADQINIHEEDMADTRENIESYLSKDALEEAETDTIDPVDVSDINLDGEKGTEEDTKDYFIQTFPKGMPYGGDINEKRDSYFYPKDK